MGEVGQYISKTNRLSANPQNEFEHKTNLIDTENKYEHEKKEGLGKFSILVSKAVLLSNINNDNLMRLYQNDALSLTHLFSMATRDARMQEVFEVLYYGWQHELSLTRTKNGEERKHQARTAGNYQPKEGMIGYGNDLEQYQQQQESNDLMAKMKGMFSKGRQ